MKYFRNFEAKNQFGKEISPKRAIFPKKRDCCQNSFARRETISPQKSRTKKRKFSAVGQVERR